jgi:hypothetical protein
VLRSRVARGNLRRALWHLDEQLRAASDLRGLRGWQGVPEQWQLREDLLGQRIWMPPRLRL